ncbi:MAG: hypothetical protein IPG71_04845 [bacterium]|nr:hypothetical protein [bacterium]
MKRYMSSIVILCVMVVEWGLDATRLVAGSGVSLPHKRFTMAMFGAGAGQPQDAGKHGRSHWTSINWEVVLHKTEHELCFRFGALTVWKIDFISEDTHSDHDFTDFGVLYGRTESWGKWAAFHASLGVALVGGETYESGEREGPDGPPTDRFVTVGAPWDITAIVTPTRQLGLGWKYWGNLNAKNSFSAWSVVLVAISPGL